MKFKSFNALCSILTIVIGKIVSHQDQPSILKAIHALLVLALMVAGVIWIFEQPLYKFLGISTWRYYESETDKMYPELGLFNLVGHPDEIISTNNLRFICDTRKKDKPMYYVVWENSSAGMHWPVTLEIKTDSDEIKIKKYEQGNSASYAPPDLLIREISENYSRGLFLMGGNAIDFYLLLKDKSYVTLKSSTASDSFILKGIQSEFEKWIKNCPTANHQLKIKLEKKSQKSK